jgi:hypothetical protein
MAGGFLLLATFGPAPGRSMLGADAQERAARPAATIEAIRPEARAPPTV